MQRGILIITPKQGEFLLSELLKQSFTEPTLLERLSAVISSPQSPTQLQLTSEEAELLLDSLPTPQASHSAELQQLRANLQQFCLMVQ